MSFDTAFENDYYPTMCENTSSASDRKLGPIGITLCYASQQSARIQFDVDMGNLC